VGWYGAAYGLIFTMTSFMSGFKDAMVPSLSRVYVHDPLQVEQWYFRTVKVIILISLPIAIGGVVIAYPLIRFLYTEEFLPSALALQILVWDIPFLMFAAFCGNMTTIIKFEKSAARIYTLNAALNVILNLLFIPRYGIIAASIVTVVTDIFSALQFYLLLHRQLKLPNLSSVLMRTLLAAGTMGVVVGLLGRQHLFVIIPIGVVVYFALALLLRLLDEDEWNFIRRVSKKLRVRFL
jgi:O-antigen/teichoic acid export membrane protein